MPSRYPDGKTPVRMPNASQVPTKKMETFKPIKQTTPTYFPSRINQRGAGLASNTDAALGCSDSGTKPAANMSATRIPTGPPIHDAKTPRMKWPQPSDVRLNSTGNKPNINV